MEISDKNFSANKTEDVTSIKMKKVVEQEQVSGQEKDMIADSKETIKNAMERAQRAIAQQQIILSGLDNIKENIIGEPDPAANRQFIEEVIAKTRFGDERVLETYKLTLLQASGKKDISVIDTIIERVNGTIHSLYAEFEKNEITRQNFLSVASFREGTNPEELIKSVIASLKKKNIPMFSLERERILDLLSE